MSEVVLCTMPFTTLEAPSIALGLLKSALVRAGIACEVVYANLAFAREVGLERYVSLRGVRNDDLLGEWIFAGAAFPDHRPAHDEYLNLVLWRRASLAPEQEAWLRSHAWSMREMAPAFVDRMAREILKRSPRVVGCSSVFMQQCASLALLRRLKEINPEVVTLLGGSNCEGEMGHAVACAFPWVDYVVSGEADLLVAPLCELIRIHGSEIPEELLPYGVMTGRSEFSAASPTRARVSEMDEVPVPCYDEYFRDLSECEFASQIVPGMFVETSRGCWWGARHHCTFCGLNGHGLNYRSKSGPAAVQMILDLHHRYNQKNFAVVDNILDMKHFETVLPSFEGLGLYLFYETKANLKRSHLEQLVRSGAHWIQPGIESLHNGVLQLMDKGTTPMINICLLKWARELGLHIAWNILYGFPGEEEQWYEEMVELFPSLFHLQAPQGVFPVRYDRFSPHQARPEQYGLELTVNPRYRYIYPFSDETLSRMAYYFQDVEHAQQERQQGRPVFRKSPAQARLSELSADWYRRFWSPLPPILSLTERGADLQIIDTRPCAQQRRVLLCAEEASLYRACEAPATAQAMAEQTGIGLERVEEILSGLEGRRLILRSDRRVLALATRGSLPRLKHPTNWPGGQLLLDPSGSVSKEKSQV